MDIQKNWRVVREFARLRGVTSRLSFFLILQYLNAKSSHERQPRVSTNGTPLVETGSTSLCPDLFAAGEKPDARIPCLSARLRTYPAIIADVSPKKERLLRRETICRVFVSCALPSFLPYCPPNCLRHSSTICQVVDGASRRIFTLKCTSRRQYEFIKHS